jgi:lipoprotein-anchoring transpeptidase ErfK/SrfK
VEVCVKKLVLALLSATLAMTFTAEPSFAGKRHRHHSKHRVHRAPPPPPIVVVNVDVSSQSMSVNVNGWPTGYWKVSTARPGYYTPRGTYRVQRTAAVYYSKKYDNAPMPYSVFFYGGYAIHATSSVRKLGSPASHGCVRLAPGNAAELYALVKEYGANRTRITITN